MKLKFAIICDNAFTDESKRLNIIQTFDIITATDFPAIHPRLTVVTNFELEKSDSKDKPYVQEVKITQRETGRVIATNTVTTKPENPDVKNIQFISYFIGLPFREEGFYDVDISLEKSSHKTSFYVGKS